MKSVSTSAPREVKNRFQLPNTLVIALFILFLTIILTWIIPAGEFARQELDGRTVVVPYSYQLVEPAPQSLLALLTAPVEGFIEASEVIAFIFIIGGAFGMLNATGAIDAGLQRLVETCVHQPTYKWVILPLVMLAFAFGGGSFGLSEELLAFVLITIPLAKSLGYDSLAGVAIPLVAANAGFAGAFANPFTVGIAQGIAEVPVFSGMGYRLIAWAVLSSIAIGYVMLYLWRLEKDKTISPLYSSSALSKNQPIEVVSDYGVSPDPDAASSITQIPERFLRLDNRRKFILLAFAATLVLLAWGATQRGWFIVEIAGLFFGMGLLSVTVAQLSLNRSTDSFISGAQAMMSACLVVALCRGILVVATRGKIIDTMLNSIATTLSGLHEAMAVQAMLLFQSLLNFFAPSGSGQAALTMPVMAPLSDLLGISRQTAVLAFQLGDGLTNLIIPTSAVTMGMLLIADIPYQVWLKWILPLMVLLYGAAMLLLLGPTLFFEWQ